MLGHLSFGVADLPRAMAFYDAALAPLGYVRVWASQTQAGYGLPGGGDRLALKLQSGPVVAPGPGFHLALVAPSRDAVNRFHAEAMRTGGRDEGAPGERPHYGANYYAAFVRDPDGHKLEAVFQ
jgi:catechol 2,3-dioxygenase-like lactoylglutathione lyase family enzyme